MQTIASDGKVYAGTENHSLASSLPLRKLLVSTNSTSDTMTSPIPQTRERMVNASLVIPAEFAAFLETYRRREGMRSKGEAMRSLMNIGRLAVAEREA